MRKAPPENCPNCGADVPRDALACPECGADESTGWSDTAYVNALDIPDENFNYDEFVEKEFGAKKEGPLKTQGVSWLWWVVALILVLAILSWFWR